MRSDRSSPATASRSSHLSPRPDDYYTRRGLNHLSQQLAVIGLSWPWGGIGELAVVKSANAVKVPDRLTDTQAALIEPSAVAVYAVDRGRVAAGSSVLVSGAGPIGALVLLAAKAAGASKLFVSETNPHRLARMKEIVPDVIAINPKTDDLVSIVRANTEEGVGVDTALECVGAEASLNACVEAVRRRHTVGRTGRPACPPRNHRCHAVGPQRHLGGGNVVLPRSELAPRRIHDRGRHLPGREDCLGADRCRRRGQERF